MNLDERVNNAIAQSEIDRRWSAVRAAMEQERIDVLLMQANNDFMGGYVKYFTDIPATNGYPVTVVFPREGAITVIGQGAFDSVTDIGAEGDGVRRGPARYCGSPSYAAIPYTTRYDSEIAARALAPYARGTIGLLGKGTISAAMIDDLRSGAVATATWIDASDLVDRIKTIKSRAELAFIRRTAALQDSSWQAVLDAIRPGMRDIEIAGIAEQSGRREGSEQGLFLCASGPIGSVAVFGNRHLQNRVIREGDYFSLLIESSGPGGYYTELGRTLVMGKATQEMRDECEFVLKARRFTLDLLVPGVDGDSLFRQYNQFLKDNGRPQEARLHCHGQGYDMVERPLMRFDEPMRLAPNMVIACHPSYSTKTTYNWICDDYLIAADGAPERLHKTEQKIFEIG